MEITPRTTRLVRVELRRQRPRLQVLQNSFRPFVRGETTMNVTTRDLGVVLTELEAAPPPPLGMVTNPQEEPEFLWLSFFLRSLLLTLFVWKNQQVSSKSLVRG